MHAFGLWELDDQYTTQERRACLPLQAAGLSKVSFMCGSAGLVPKVQIKTNAKRFKAHYSSRFQFPVTLDIGSCL